MVDYIFKKDGRGEVDGILVLYYPPGCSMLSGGSIDNSAIAKQVITRLRLGSRIALPTGWRLEFVKGDPAQVEVVTMEVPR
jgi:hypothetical protein